MKNMEDALYELAASQHTELLAGSIDAEYRLGQPKTYLTPLELARLTILGSRLGETRIEREAEECRA